VFPAGCPAIVALGRAGTVARGLIRLRTTLNTIGVSSDDLFIQRIADESVSHQVGPVTRVLSDFIASNIASRALPLEPARVLAKESVSAALEGGLSGLINWGVHSAT
jgi:hypothetical protein